MYGPPVTETAFIFLTNYVILELHLNYSLISFAFFFPGLYRMYCNNTNLCVKVTFTQ